MPLRSLGDWLAVSVMVLVDSSNDPLVTVGSSSTVAESADERSCGTFLPTVAITWYQYFWPTVGLECVHEVDEAPETFTFVLDAGLPSFQYHTS